MRKINDTKELNEIYSQINKLIQQYIESHNILPSEIYKYVKKNMNRFLERNNLKDIEKIDQIVEDVIKHRFGMERDQVIPFSKYSQKLNESILLTGLGSVEHEKILADYYNSSLGHISPIDYEMHLYQIDDFGDSKKVIVFSDEEVQKISENIINKIYQELKKVNVTIDSLEGQTMNISLDFLLDPMITESIVKENIKSKLDKEKLLELIGNLIPTSFIGQEMIGLVSFKEYFKGFYIWEI